MAAPLFTPRLSASCSPHVIGVGLNTGLSQSVSAFVGRSVSGALRLACHRPCRPSASRLSASRPCRSSAFRLSASGAQCLTRPLHHAQSSRLSASGAQCVILPPAFGLSALRIMCTVCDPASGLVMLGPRPACRQPASRLTVDSAHCDSAPVHPGYNFFRVRAGPPRLGRRLMEPVHFFSCSSRFTQKRVG